MNFFLNRHVAIYLTALVLSGCLAFTPHKMYEGPTKNKKDIVTIIGQDHWKGWGEPRVQVTVSKVDGKQVVGLVEPFVIQLDPGTHDLTISARYGNLFHPRSPTIRVFVEAGQVYQIDSRLAKAADGGTAANYSLRYIGDVDELEDYLAKHPEFKPGSLLPKLGKTSLPRLEQHKTFSPEQFLNYKSPSSNLR